MANTFNSQHTINVNGREYRIAKLGALDAAGISIDRLPYALRILLENLLRHEDGTTVPAEDIEAMARTAPGSGASTEIAFRPGRVLLQDFTGVPALVDLAAMRDAMQRLGGDPELINPLQPAELVIDHSVQVDAYGTAEAIHINRQHEFERNRERYAFLRWGQSAFNNFKVVPPNTGIVHQVNLEYLARVVMVNDDGWAYPDTLVGTDSHTTMVNGLGVLGWGVGGIEAEAAMLGQPISMLIPDVVGFKLTGRLAEGATATDLVLTVTQMLRAHGVVGKFVEFFGSGLSGLPLADRATISNMAPEYGATAGIFPIDDETLRYLRFSGRPESQVELVEVYAKEQGLFHTTETPPADYVSVLELDLGSVEPSLAGPKRPQDRVALSDAKSSFEAVLRAAREGANGGEPAEAAPVELDGERFVLEDGSVVIAAITSCTNTSNPSVMVAAGLVAKKASERGLTVKPWVKTSLAPGSKVVTDYLERSGLLPFLEQQRFNVVGYGCTTCIGNSGPLRPEISAAIEEGDLMAVAVLSGNRNFEGRIHGQVRANYLASPPLVVAYALAGRMDIDLTTEPLGLDQNGEPVFLKDVWPSQHEIQATIGDAVKSDMFRASYADVFTGPEEWQAMPVPKGSLFTWDTDSTYVKHPPFFEGLTRDVPDIRGVEGARVLAYLGDSVTTDHISPAGSIERDSPAGRYLVEHGVDPRDFNSYGSRRGNHEVMMRGTFANIRLRNKLVPGVEGGFTRMIPGDGAAVAIYDAAMAYREDAVPLVILGGKEYGSGSSRDWAAKGTRLLGVHAVLTESFERIHRSNLVGMGVLPLEFPSGETAESLGLTGEERFDIQNPDQKREIEVVAHGDDGRVVRFRATVRLDTPQEWEYYRHGGILPYVIRQLLDA